MTKASKVFEVLTQEAYFQNSTLLHRHTSGMKVKRHIDRGEAIPEHLLPGRLVMKLSTEDRESLSKLKAGETWHRRPWVG